MESYNALKVRHRKHAICGIKHQIKKSIFAQYIQVLSHHSIHRDKKKKQRKTSRGASCLDTQVISLFKFQINSGQ